MPARDRLALLENVSNIARLAGDVIMALYSADQLDVRHKTDQSPVTQADIAANKVLVRALAPLLDACQVVSEEDEAALAHRLPHGRFWLIDPLDGTKEFLARNGEFTVNVALIDEGRSMLGVVYAPAIDMMYAGGPGIGAFRRSADTPWSPIKVGKGDASGNIRVVASKNHLNAETRSFIERLGPVSLIQAGSSLKFCRIAEDAADIYPRLAPTCEWDTAAAQAVLEGAGGFVHDFHGQPLHYGKPDVLNPSFVAARDSTLWHSHD